MIISEARIISSKSGTELQIYRNYVWYIANVHYIFAIIFIASSLYDIYWVKVPYPNWLFNNIWFGIFAAICAVYAKLNNKAYNSLNEYKKLVYAKLIIDIENQQVFFSDKHINFSGSVKFQDIVEFAMEKAKFRNNIVLKTTTGVIPILYGKQDGEAEWYVMFLNQELIRKPK